VQSIVSSGCPVTVDTRNCMGGYNWLRLPCGSATKYLSHEGALGVGGGSTSTCIRFQPLVFILERSGEKNLL
jgi:hypothetical protein